MRPEPPPPLYPPEPGVEYAAELNGARAEAESNVPGMEGAETGQETALAVGDYVKVVEALARQCPDTRGVIWITRALTCPLRVQGLAR